MSRKKTSETETKKPKTHKPRTRKPKSETVPPTTPVPPPVEAKPTPEVETPKAPSQFGAETKSKPTGRQRVQSMAAGAASTQTVERKVGTGAVDGEVSEPFGKYRGPKLR